MAISPQAPLCTDTAYAKTATSSWARFLPLLGSVLVLTACAATTSSPLSTLTSAKEKNMTTVTPTARPIKTYQDGSKPFTMPELQERLLKVLALPPEQIGKKSVEQAFGFTLFKEDGDAHGGFFKEEFSEDKRVSYLVTLSSPSGSAVFEYNTLIQKVWEDGSPMLSTMPREIPAAYKFAYPSFVQKLQALGWQPDGEYRNVGYYWNYFKKDDFRLELHIDDYLGTVYDPPDYSQTGISRIVIKAPFKR